MRRSPAWLVRCALLAALTGAGCRKPTVDTASAARGNDGPVAIRFTDVAERAGITFRHESGRSGRFYLPETMGSGCAFLDYNNDGHLDLFLVNGRDLTPRPPSPAGRGVRGVGPTSALYRNNGDGTFADVTRAAGLEVECYGMGCAVGDYDDDGYPDLYLTALGPNVLFHNNGDGTFSNVTKVAGVGDPRFSTSAAFLDYDRDGRLDLFVCNYCVWAPSLNPVLTDAQGRKHMAGPRRYKGAPSALYRNRGDGTFEDVTRRAGVYSPFGKSLGVLVSDLNDDGWPDLVVANDMEPNRLYRNNADSTFREVGLEAGVAYANTGKARAGMGIDSADIANDGREAIVIGNNSTEGLALFQSVATGQAPASGVPAFTDIAEAAGIFTPSLPFLTFGALFVDLDNDGLKDLFAANGHVDEAIQYSQPNTTFAERPLLFRNQGIRRTTNGAPAATAAMAAARGKRPTGQSESLVVGRSSLVRFEEIGAAAGSALQAPTVARGVAAGDFDADGDLDLLVSVCNGRPMLLRNDLFPSTKPIHSRSHWLAVRARGVQSNRNGIGTRVTVEAGGVRRQGWIRSGSSYCSAGDLVAWFGLGAAANAERVTLRWPSGTVQTLTDVAVDREIVVEEGKGIVDRAPAGSSR